MLHFCFCYCGIYTQEHVNMFKKNRFTSLHPLLIPGASRLFMFIFWKLDQRLYLFQCISFSNRMEGVSRGWKHKTSSKRSKLPSRGYLQLHKHIFLQDSRFKLHLTSFTFMKYFLVGVGIGWEEVNRLSKQS